MQLYNVTNRTAVPMDGKLPILKVTFMHEDDLVNSHQDGYPGDGIHKLTPVFFPETQDLSHTDMLTLVKRRYKCS